MTFQKPIVIVALLAVAGLGIWFWPSVVSPRMLYRSARPLIDKDPAAAAEMLEEAVTLRQGNYPEAQFLWTRALLKSGRSAEALGCFSLIKKPGDLAGEKLISLGSEASAQHVLLLARLAYEAVPEHSEHYTNALQEIVPIKYQTQRWMDVISICRKIKSTQQELAADNLFFLASSYEKVSDFTQAQTAYAEFIERESTNLELRKTALRSLARIATQLGEIDAGQGWLDTLGQQASFTIDDTLMQAKLLIMQGLQDEASLLVKQVLEQQPMNKEGLLLRGSLAFMQRDLDNAQAEFEKVLELDPWSREAHYKLAQVLQQLGHSEEAEVHFERNRNLNESALQILELQRQAPLANDSERMKKLAQAYEDLGQFEMAELLRQNLKQATPD